MLKKFLSIAVLTLVFGLSGNVFAEGLKTVGIVNYRKIFTEYKKTKEFQKEIEKKDEEAKTELENMAQEVRKLRDQMELLSEKAREPKEAELNEKTNNLNEFRRKKTEELVRWRDDKMREINNSIVNATEAYAKKNGCDVIFDQMAAVYYDPKYDVTDKVLGELNK